MTDTVTWRRVTDRTGDRGRTVYWNAPLPDGWRLAVSRVDYARTGTAWQFAAYKPVPGNGTAIAIHPFGANSVAVTLDPRNMAATRYRDGLVPPTIPTGDDRP